MARTTCQRSASHEGVWKCSCEAGGDFCSSCILSHMGVQTGGTAHSVTPIATPVGNHACGRCHGQSIDSIFFNCEVCLCGDCTRELSAPGTTRELMRFGEHEPPAEEPGLSPGSYMSEGSGTPSDEEHNASRSSLAEEHSSYARSSPDSSVAVDRESAAAQGAASTLFQKYFQGRKEGIRNSLKNALTEMEKLKELAKLIVEMEAKLGERHHEKPRDERWEVIGTNEDLPQVLQDVTRENALLSAELQNLKGQHQAQLEALNQQLETLKQENHSLKQQYQDLENEAGKGLQEALKKELNTATKKLQQSLNDQLAEAARTAAIRVTDVMPLIAQVDLENSWLDLKSVEEFFSLALLSIEGLVSPADMFQVARSYVRVAKFFGPNPLMADLAASVSKRIRENKATGIQFLSEFYGVYEFVKEEKGKEVLSALLKLLEKEDLIIQAMEIVSHLRKLVNVQCLSDFTIAISAYFQQKGCKPREWKVGLLGLPVAWTDQYRSRAEECTTEFLCAVCEKNFSDGYLQLSELLRQGNDPESLFYLVKTLTKLMKADNIAQELQQLVKKLLKLINTSATPQIEIAFSILKHLLIETEKRNIKLLAKCIYKIYNHRNISSLVVALVRVLARLSDKDEVPKLGFAVLKWALEGQDESVAFAEQVMHALEEDQATLDETAVSVSGLLAGPPRFILSLLTQRVSTSGVCEFTVALLKDPQSASMLELFLSVLSEVACSAGPQRAEEWMQLTKLVVKANLEEAVQTYQVYSAFGKRQIQDEEMAKLGVYVLGVFRSSENDSLKNLLATMEKALNDEDFDYTVLKKLLGLWRSYHQHLQEDPRSCEAISYFIEKVVSPGIPELVADLKDTVEVNERAYASATLALVKVHMFSDDPNSAQSFVTAALGALKGMAEDQRVTFEEFIGAAVCELQEGQTLNLLESIFRLKAAIFDQLFQLFTVNRPAIVGAFRVLKHLLRDNDASQLQLLADSIAEIRDNEAVATLIDELVQVLEKLTQQEIVSQLGFAVLKLAMGKQDWSVEFAEKLLKALELDSPALGESSIRVAKVLSSEPEFQSGIRALVERAVPISVVCQFASVLLGDLCSSEQTKLFLKVLHDVATVDSAKVPIWMQLTQSIMVTNNHALVRVYEMCSEFVRRGVRVDKAEELGQFMLNVIQTEANESLRELQETVRNALGLDGLQCSLLFRAMTIWTNYHKLLPNDQRPCRLVCFFAENLNRPEIPTQLEAFEAVVETNEAYAATTLTLAEVFMPAYACKPKSGQGFLMAALGTLKRIHDSGKINNLVALVRVAVQFAQGEEQAASFLELVFTRSAEVTDRLLEFFDGEQPTPISTAFEILKRLLRDPEGQEELQLLAACIEDIKTNEGIKRLAEVLVTVMEALKDKEDVISTLGFSVLRWAHEHFSHVEFAQHLVRTLETSPQTLEVASVHVAKVLTSTPEFQASVQALINSSIPTSIVCEFGSALLEDLPPQWGFVMNTLHAMAKLSDQKEVMEWMSLTKVVIKTKNDITMKFYEMLEALVREVQSDEVVRLGKYLLDVVHSLVNLEPLKQLLDTAVRVLMEEGVQYEVILKVLMLWRKHHSLGTDDEQCYEVLIHFLERVGSPEVPALVTDLEASTRDANYASNSLALVKVYKLAYTLKSDVAPLFIAAALATLKRMRDDAQRDNLKMLVEAVLKLQGPVEAALLLSRVFNLKETVLDQLLVVFTKKQIRIGTIFHMLKFLLRDSKLEEDEVQLIEKAVERVCNNDTIVKLVAALKPALEKLKDSTEASKFGFNVLKWAFKNKDVELVLQLVRALKPNSPTLPESLRDITKVLSSAPHFQSGVKTLIEANIPTSNVCEFAAEILDDLQLSERWNLFLEVLQNVATMNLEKAKEWLRLMKSLPKEKNEVMIRAYEACNAFWKRGHQTPEVVELIQSLICELKYAEISDSFKTLLNTLVQTLFTGGLKYEIVFEIMKLWASAPNDRARHKVTTYLISRVSRADTIELVTDFEEAVHNAKGAYAAIAFSLTKYVLAIDEERAKGLFITALHVLKGLRDGSHRDSLRSFINTTVRDFQGNKLFLLEALFRPTAKDAEALSVTLDRLKQLLLLPATCQVVKSLSELQQCEYYHVLQSILVPSLKVTKAVSKLLDLAKYLLAKGEEPPDVRKLEQVVQQRPRDVVALVDPALLAMVGASPAQSHIADRLLQELSRRNELQLLRFIATLATDLISHVPQPLVSQLCSIFLDNFDNAKGLLQDLGETMQYKFAEFVVLLNRCGNAITLRDIQEFQYRLAHIQKTSVRMFNFQSKMWKQSVELKENIWVYEDSSWTFLDNNRLFCCGGEGEDYAGYFSNSIHDSIAYKEIVGVIQLDGEQKWAPIRLQDMNIARRRHGILHYAPKDLVYVFGGGKGHPAYDVNLVTKECEKFLLTPQPPNLIQIHPWEKLREEMKRARYYFNPCLYRGMVYLCGDLSAAMEVFSPDIEKFDLCGIDHPENSPCCVYVQGNLLVVHSECYIVMYSWENEKLMPAETKRTDRSGKWQSSQPVVVGGLVYIVQGSAWASFDINTGNKIEYVPTKKCRHLISSVIK